MISHVFAIRPHTLPGILLIHAGNAGIKVNPCWQNGPEGIISTHNRQRLELGATLMWHSYCWNNASSVVPDYKPSNDNTMA